MKLIKCGTAMFVILCFLFSTTAYALDYKYFPDVPDDASYALEIKFLQVMKKETLILTRA